MMEDSRLSSSESEDSDEDMCSLVGDAASKIFPLFFSFGFVFLFFSACFSFLGLAFFAGEGDSGICNLKTEFLDHTRARINSKHMQL